MQIKLSNRILRNLVSESSYKSEKEILQSASLVSRVKIWWIILHCCNSKNKTHSTESQNRRHFKNIAANFALIFSDILKLLWILEQMIILISLQYIEKMVHKSFTDLVILISHELNILHSNYRIVVHLSRFQILLLLFIQNWKIPTVLFFTILL